VGHWWYVICLLMGRICFLMGDIWFSGMLICFCAFNGLEMEFNNKGQLIGWLFFACVLL